MRSSLIPFLACLLSTLSAASAVAQSAAGDVTEDGDQTTPIDLGEVPAPPQSATAVETSDSDEFDSRFDTRTAPPPASTDATRLSAPAPYGASAPSIPRFTNRVPAPPTAAAPGATSPLFVVSHASSDPIAARAARRRHRRFRWAPDVQPGIRFELRLMPFVSDVAGGVLLDASLRHQTRSGFWSSVRLGPFGVAHAGPDNIGVADAGALIGMAWRLFGVGVGGGLAYVRFDDLTRRARGLAPTYSFYLRFGALYGVHVSITTLGAIVGGDTAAAGARVRLRIPMRHHDLLDFDLDAVPASAYVYMGVSYERGLDEWSRLRIRPHVGLVEVIDPVTRDGGAGFSIGVALVYRTDGPADEYAATASAADPFAAAAPAR